MFLQLFFMAEKEFSILRTEETHKLRKVLNFLLICCQEVIFMSFVTSMLSQTSPGQPGRKKTLFFPPPELLIAFTAPSFYFDSFPSFITVIAIQ